MSEAAPIVIIGAGEQAEIAYEYFTVDSDQEVVAFAVEREYLREPVQEGLPVVALEELSDRFDPATHQTFVAISSQQLNRVRRRLFDEVKRQGFTCASFISPHAFVWRNVEIGENCFIFENNVLQHHVSVGDNCVLWSGNHVGHRTVIEEDVFIASHVVISGYCRIGARSFVGVNSTFGDGLSIAPDSVVGAGAVVHKSLPEPRGVYVGNPARPTGRDSFATFKVEE
ncbi:MAG: sugar O-acyltransferase [Solirubrobacterales bacterium]|jgi:sugar O-acyltransferase (sialic acid O-acetyltransferase NeuD family)|nr:sugar O-acyltransferase [Solirubrobacterales bacterium]